MSKVFLIGENPSPEVSSCPAWECPLALDVPWMQPPDAFPCGVFTGGAAFKTPGTCPWGMRSKQVVFMGGAGAITVDAFILAASLTSLP